MLKMASRINGVSHLVFNKMDILDQLNTWCAYEGPSLYSFQSKEDIEVWLESKLQLEVNKDMNVIFSGDKENI
jgi:adenylosuccinate synthase